MLEGSHHPQNTNMTMGEGMVLPCGWSTLPETRWLEGLQETDSKLRKAKEKSNLADGDLPQLCLMPVFALL